MGRKRTGKGKYVHFCIAILTCLSLSQCAALDRSPLVQGLLPQDEAGQHLARAQKLFAQGDYEGAVEENQKVLPLAGNKPPGDEALYSLGLIYAYPGNPKRDYVKSIAVFKRLIKQYPQSPRTEQGKIWVKVLEENENSKRVAATLTQENDKLKRIIEESKKEAAAVTQENDKLKRIIEESKKVDIEIEKKKREEAR